MDTVITGRNGHEHGEHLNKVTSVKGSSLAAGESHCSTGYQCSISPSIADGHHGRPSTPLEVVAGNPLRIKQNEKPPEVDGYSTLTRRFLEPTSDDGRAPRRPMGLRLPSTRLTVYPQRDVAGSWKGKRDFSLPRLDVLKVQVESQWANNERHDNKTRPLPMPVRVWSGPSDLVRTQSADSYFHHGFRPSKQQKGAFHSREQMERAFSTHIKSYADPSSPRRRPNTVGSSPAAASPSLQLHSAPCRERIVRKSPPWKSLMNRRTRGVRATKASLCPFHCRCCFAEVNDIQGSHVYKMDLGTL